MQAKRAMDAAEVEELTLCGCCKQKFNDADRSPKMLSCKHYFCLHCARTSLNKGQELYCMYCWKRTEVGDGGPDSLPTYAPVLHLAKSLSRLRLSGGGGGGGGGAAPGAPPQKAQPPDKPPASASGGGPPASTSKSAVVSENCHTHAMPLALWCHTCASPVCRACAATQEHSSHQIKSHHEAKDHLVAELHLELASMTKLHSEIQRLAVQQREFLLKVLEACVTLKTHVEADLTANASHFGLAETRDALSRLRAGLSTAESLSEVHQLGAGIANEKQRFQLRYQDMLLQCQLDDLIRNASIVLDFQLLKQALNGIQSGEIAYPRIVPPTQQNPILFLANYCMSQLYSRHVLTKQQQQMNGGLDYAAASYNVPQPKIMYHQDVAALSPQIRNPSNVCPLYFFNIEVNGGSVGRIVIEVRADVAPRMARNFEALATGEAGVGYRGCHVFQCWEGESVITGDFEHNNGRGGRSAFDDSYFLPDDTKLPATRGTVGMRRTQKRHDNMGMVGSQFRIILQEMRGFTGIFGHVVEGLELVEKISSYGDTAGKPTKTVLIAKCGKLQ